MSEEYIPYGPEWKKEISKLPKDKIVDMLAIKGKECEDLKEELGTITPRQYRLLSGFVINVSSLTGFERHGELMKIPRKLEEMAVIAGKRLKI